jgi:flagellar biogenesis protein FliO
LSPPGRSNRDPAAKSGGLPSPAAMAGSLAVVLGLFFAVVWVMRGATPKGLVLLPGEVVEVLGRAPLAGRQQVHLLRCGNKLLLVSVTPAGAETLTEVTDPLEVDRLAGLCRQAHPHSATAAFRQVLQQFGPRAESRDA